MSDRPQNIALLIDDNLVLSMSQQNPKGALEVALIKDKEFVPVDLWAPFDSAYLEWRKGYDEEVITHVPTSQLPDVIKAAIRAGRLMAHAKRKEDA